MEVAVDSSTPPVAVKWSEGVRTLRHSTATICSAAQKSSFVCNHRLCWTIWNQWNQILPYGKYSEARNSKIVIWLTFFRFQFEIQNVITYFVLLSLFPSFVLQELPWQQWREELFVLRPVFGIGFAGLPWSSVLPVLILSCSSLSGRGVFWPGCQVPEGINWRNGSSEDD